MYRVRQQVECDDRVLLVPPKRRGAIAVLDTGVARHPDLTNRILDFRDFVFHKTGAYDDSGHGTHVCGIACGDGRASRGRYRGMSPFSNLIVGKVLDHQGNGSVDSMVEGIRWVLSEQKRYDIRILNISIGIGQLKSKEKELILQHWLETAWEAGLVVVCAAGNGGPDWGTLSPLGTSSKVITVGCHDGSYFKGKANRCETYSGRASLFTTVRKPEVVAPGTDIVSCDSRCIQNRGGYSYAYTPKSGTSMATPIVAGGVSVFLQKKPEYTNEAVKRQLLYTATDLGEPWCKQGYGMINVRHMLDYDA